MIKLNNKKWLGEQIKEDIENWSKGDLITIQCGTGAGKSYFVKNDLYEYAKKNNKKILLLVHRLNCLNQFKQKSKGKGKHLKIMTYQKIDNVEKNGGKFDFSDYDYIVSDEFHYFTADANFNKITDYSLEAILRQDDKVKILMSATAQLMSRYLNRIRGLETISYTMPFDFSFIKSLNFYSSDGTEEELLNSFKEKGQKSLIFIDHLSRLNKLYSQHKEYSLFNCSSSREEYRSVDEDKINQMLKKEKFDELFLFSTSVMDTGVSIKDKGVVNVVCSNILDVNTIIQMIGRKRILDKNDKINLYIRSFDNMRLNGFKKRENDKLQKVILLDEEGKSRYIDKYGREKDSKDILYFQNDKDGITIKRNDMAYIKTLETLYQVENMLETGYNEYLAKELQFKEKYNILEDIEKMNKLKEYLDRMANKRLYSKEEKNTLCEFVGLRDENNRLVKGFEAVSGHIEDVFDSEYILIKKRDRRSLDENGEENPYQDKTFYLIVK